MKNNVTEKNIRKLRAKLGDEINEGPKVPLDTFLKNPAAQALGRLGGKAKSAAKAAAARENGKLGGWPKGRKRKVNSVSENKTK